MNTDRVIWIIGSSGQLGRTMRDTEPQWASDVRVLYSDLEVDITDIRSVDAFIKQNKITHLVNCAAYTQVDKAEDELELARLLNAKAVENIAQCCCEYGVFPIHISTDYVYEGTQSRPYVEQDLCKPNTVYGLTKMEGELALKGVQRGVIIRTSWLYSNHGNNFVFTMQKLGSGRDQLQVVFDQVGSPTYAVDLATAIWIILRNEERIKSGVEIFNFSNEGVCSWYDFAQEIMYVSKLDCVVLPIRSEAFPQKARRPAYSVMDKTKIKMFFDIAIPHWRQSLLLMLENNQH